MTAARPLSASAPMSPEQRQQLADASVAAQFETIATAATGCDVIVAATALQIAARSVAEKQGIRYLFAAYCPIVLPSRTMHRRRCRRYPARRHSCHPETPNAGCATPSDQ